MNGRGFFTVLFLSYGEKSYLLSFPLFSCLFPGLAVWFGTIFGLSHV